jgi:hypothetical protein
VAEPVRELDHIVRMQLAGQQSQLNRELVQNEYNNLGHKFNYLIELERDRYKRNIKDLVKCKKEFYLESRREEIRANGIKRFKRFGDEQFNKKVT